jgi:hypothetical protein
VQCEVVRNKIAYEMPPPQDQVLENNILEHDMTFDFIGLGQPANGIAQADGWEPWPDQGEEVNQEANSAEVGAELQNVQAQIADVEQQLAQLHPKGSQGEHVVAGDNIGVA